MTDRDRAFQMSTANLRFGTGITREVGMDLAELDCRRVLLLTDAQLVDLPPVATVCESLRREGIDFEIFSDIRVEPSDRSFAAAIDAAKSGSFAGFVAVGGGSVIDTAKAANLYSTYPADLLTYVNAPIGAAQPVPGPLKPLVAVPTTAGTGSETTGVAIFDFLDQKFKTGIAHRLLKPTLGIVDPDNTRTMPPMVAASTGLDVLCHAVESYTALPFDERPRPERPALRPAYQGSNPVSDIWAEQAMAMVAEYLVREVEDLSDDEARSNMLLASSYAGMGFGNAGVHLCHGMSYPASSTVRQSHPPGYPDDHPILPHGVSVVLTAPAVFRFTAQACPERHLRAAALLGADTDDVPPEHVGTVLAERIAWFMKRLNLPNGLGAVGFTGNDCPALAEGTLPQHRVTKLAPRAASQGDLEQLFRESLSIW